LLTPFGVHGAIVAKMLLQLARRECYPAGDSNKKTAKGFA